MNKKVFFDESDSQYDDIDWFDVEMWFDNKHSHKTYIVVGLVEQWDRKGSGFLNKTFNSIYQAIQGANEGWGITYVSIYEGKYGRLFIDVCHHDGTNHFEIRELTKKGEEKINSNYYGDAMKDIANKKGYTRNVKFSKRYW